MTPSLRKRLFQVAHVLRTSPQSLWKLIDFESRWNPLAGQGRAKGPWGLIQFLPSTLTSLGLTPEQLFALTAEQQLDVVQRYLAHYDVTTEQRLYMAVFYPAAQQWPPSKAFPEHVQKANPGIATVQDYLDLVNNREVPDDIAYPKLPTVRRRAPRASTITPKALVLVGLGVAGAALIVGRLLRRGPA